MKETVIKVNNCRNCPLYNPIYDKGTKYAGCNYTKIGFQMSFNDEYKNPKCKVIEVVIKEED